MPPSVPTSRYRSRPACRALVSCHAGPPTLLPRTGHRQHSAPGPFVGSRVEAGDTIDDARLHLRCRVAVEGGQTHAGRLSFPHLVDVGWGYLGLELQLRVVRDDRRDLRCRRYDTADGKDRQLVDVARNRRADLRARQAIVDRQLSLVQLGQASIDRPSSRWASVLAFWSMAMICTRISLARALARAILASLSPISPGIRAQSRRAA